MESKVEIERKIKTYKNKIATLEDENRKLNKKRNNFEETISLLQNLSRQFEQYLEGSFSTAKRAFLHIDPDSGLENHYMNQLNAILNSHDSNNAINEIENNKRSITNSIFSYDDKIEANNKKINYYNNQIKILKQKLATAI